MDDKKMAQALKEQMQHKELKPTNNPIGNYLTKWGKGVKERLTAEGFAKALKEGQFKFPPDKNEK